MSLPAAESRDDRPVDLSVVVPTRNGGSLFERVLAGIEAQIFDGSVEYVIVDSGSEDGTDVAAASRGWRVVSIDPLQFHHGRTRNLGVSRTRGRFIVLMTQDAVPFDRLLFQRLVDPFADPAVGGVCARQIPRSDADPVTRRHMARWPASSTLARVTSARTPEELRRLPPHEQYMECRFDNVCGAVRREAWEQHPFPECDFGEDLAWGVRAVCGGWKLCYQPQALVAHSHDRSPFYDFKRAYCYGWQMAELFGICNLSTPAAAWNLALGTVRSDVDFLRGAGMQKREKWRIGFRSTLRTLAGVAGQYLGVRDWRCNVSRTMKGI